MYKIIRNIFKWLLNILIVLAFIFLILGLHSFISIKVKHHDYANYFGYTFMNISSGSMEPTIKVDDYVFIKIGNNKLKEKDVITFKDNNAIITHRIIKIEDDSIITKGDANNTQDNPIKKENVIGKVVYVGKNMGVYSKIVKTPAVFISFFVAIILFDIALSNKEVIDGEKKKEE